MSVFIIAEAGVNHNGDITLAHRLIDVAAQSGADAVKFQTFIPEKLVASATPQAAYQARNTGQQQSQLEMLRQLALPLEAFAELKAHCDEAGIEFMSTPFEEDSLEYLLSIGMRRIKVPSGELLSTPFLRAIGQAGLPTILSTGMATLEEVRHAVETLLQAGLPKADLTILHCTSAYPTPPEAVNLRAMRTLADTFHVPVGLSDHTEGLNAAVAATALGASVLEKHFTLDKSLPGPDHRASLTPGELRALVDAVRETQCMLGSGEKMAMEAEANTRSVARRRIVAARPIRAGEAFTPEKVTLKRAPSGWFGDRWDDVIGQVAPRDYATDEGIAW
ncbi:N-acetylneuraminate synthase [Sulfurivirga caldicuralii]|uniref:N-acetylneuraminate synthase n=1 Tax=Sulfurivirga caldicuralii TaxID=364032 RepID=A0A1N6E6B2_9GAMM|nr:N-acetylneuraminate synthase [Sulfurivirga caldicuralii]SIN78558.1 N-acetylneuraminate synthase [Sulfurivirga caldicuralii]